MIKLVLFLLLVSYSFSYMGVDVDDGLVKDFQCFKQQGSAFYVDNFDNDNIVKNMQNAKAAEVSASFMIEPDTKTPA